MKQEFNEDELDDDQKQVMSHFMKLQEENQAKMEKVMLIPLCLIIAAMVKFVPNFSKQLFAPVKSFDQPLSYTLNSKLQSLAGFVAPLVPTILGFYVLKTKGNMLGASLIIICLMFANNWYQFMLDNFSVALPAILSAIAYAFSHNLLLNDPYGFRWYINYIICAVLCFLSVYMKGSCVGIASGCYVAVFISSFSRIGAAKGNRGKTIWEMILLLFASYIVILPATLVFLKMRSDGLTNPINSQKISLSDYASALKKYNDPSLIICSMLAIILLPFGKYRYINLVPVIQLIIGALTTAFIHWETPGDAMMERLFYIELQLVTLAGIVLSKQKYNATKFVAGFIILAVAIYFKVRLVGDAVRADTDAQIETIRRQQEDFEGFSFDF